MRHRRQVVHQRVDRLTLRQNLSQQKVGVDDELGDLIAALAEHCRDRVGVGQKVAQLRVAGVEGVGEPSDAFQGGPQFRRRFGESVRQRGERLRQLRGVESADGGGQITQRGGQVVGRFRSLERDGAGEVAVAARCDFEHLGAEHGFGLDRRLGAVTEFDAVANSEVHQHFRAVQLDIGHPANRHTRHPNVAAGLDPAGLGEVGGVVGCALDERDLVVGERRDHGGDEHGDPDKADGEPVALGEGFHPRPLELRSVHFGVHRPVSWPASFTYTGWPPLPLTLRTASQR